MNKEDQEHLIKIVDSSEKDLMEKYIKGADEHGGHLRLKGIRSLIAKEMRAEAIDQVVYTHCLTEGLNEISKLVEQRLDFSAFDGEQNKMDIAAFERIQEILKGKEKDKDV